MTGWQPIDTAPRDGEIILISGPGARGPYVEAAYWSQCPRAYGGDKRYPWVTLDETNGVNGRMECSPAHWMKLPPHPAIADRNPEGGNAAGGAVHEGAGRETASQNPSIPPNPEQTEQ